MTEDQIFEEIGRMQQAAQRRAETLSQAAHARAQHSLAALTSATSELAPISGGAPDGAHWAEDASDFDSLMQKSQALFASFDAAAAERSIKKVERAMNAYRKDATEAGVPEKDVVEAVEAAEKQAQRGTATMKEAQFMAAVLTGGKIGMEHCRIGLASMVSEKLPTTSVHPVLFAEVQRLMKSGGASGTAQP